MNKNELSKQNAEPENDSNKITGKQLKTSLISFIGYFFLSFIPYLISLVLWYFAVISLKLWNLESNLILISYGVIILICSLLISYGMAVVTERLRYSKIKSKPGKSRRWQRIFMVIFGGLVIPIALSVIAFKVPVRGEDTVSTFLLETMESNSEISYVQIVGDAVINSGSIDTRIAGINALATFRTDESLAQLIGILDHYGCGFEGWSYLDYQKFSKAYTSAIATYGAKAIDPLLEIFYKCDDQEPDNSTVTSSDLFSEKFEQQYGDMELLINQAENLSSIKKENFMDRLNNSKSDLEILLNEFGKEVLNSEGNMDSEAAIRLVFQSINKMTLSDEYPILHTLSSRIAIDSSYHDATRIEAITLLAKIGSLDDLKLLLPNLEGNNEKMKEATLKAIDDLVSKAGGLQDNKDN